MGWGRTEPDYQQIHKKSSYIPPQFLPTAFMLQPRVYLANYLGFSELGRATLQKIVTRLAPEFEVIEPFTTTPDFADQLHKIEQGNLLLPDMQEQLHAVNTRIGESNKIHLNECDLVVAFLDQDDPGTTAEVGYAYAIGKPVWGYYGDFRLRGDNLGVWVNLQVQYFIEESGGCICRTLDDLVGKLTQWRSESWTQ